MADKQNEGESENRGGRGMESVRDVMTRNPKTTTPDASLQDVARMMRDDDVGAVPVVESSASKKAVGMVTDRDIVIRIVSEGRNPADAKVSDAMTKGVSTVRESDSLNRVFKVMSEDQVRRVVVVDDNGELCGIIAQADIATESNQSGKVARVLEEISEKSH